MRSPWLVPCFLLAASPCWAQDLYSGTWSNPEMTLTLKAGDGLFTGQFASRVAKGNLLGGISDEGLLGNYNGSHGAGVFTARLDGRNLVATWGNQTTVLQRGGPRHPPAHAPPPPGAPETPTHSDARNGWQMGAPPGWRLAGHGAEVSMACDAEPGLIQAAFVPGLDVDGALEFLDTPHDMNHGTWHAEGEPKPFPMQGAKAMVVAGKIQSLKGHLVAHTVIVMGPRGSVVIVGYAPKEQAANIAKRVEDAARSVRFVH